jgi:hypothetical protein
MVSRQDYNTTTTINDVSRTATRVGHLELDPDPFDYVRKNGELPASDQQSHRHPDPARGAERAKSGLDA